jgi:hypothetical protein
MPVAASWKESFEASLPARKIKDKNIRNGMGTSNRNNSGKVLCIIVEEITHVCTEVSVRVFRIPSIREMV